MATLKVLQVVDGRLTAVGADIIGQYSLSTTGTGALPPRWAGDADVRPSWHPPVYNGEARATTHIREMVEDARQGRRDIEILFIGDSKTEGTGVENDADTALKVGQYSYPGQLRRMLGAVEAFIPAVSSDEPRWDGRWDTTAMTRPSAAEGMGIIPANPGSGDQKSIAFTESAFTSFELRVRIVAGGDITLTVDGTDTTETIPAAEGWTALTRAGLDVGEHTVTITTTADVEVLGITLGTTGNRLRVSRAGVRGSTAAQWLETGPADLWPSVQSATAPDAIFCQIGTNNARDLASITALHQQFAGLGVPFVIISPGGMIHPAPGLYEPMQEQHYLDAAALDVPLIDFQAVIGDQDTAHENGLMWDGGHENAKGYSLEGQAVRAFIAG